MYYNCSFKYCIVTICLLYIFKLNVISQNLVINPSFEGDSCDISDFNNNTGIDVPEWEQLFTADYYTIHNCRNKIKYRMPRSGKSCVGIFVNTISIYLGKRYVFREYLVGKLKDELVRNHKYSICFYVKPSYTIDEVEKVFTTRNVSLSFVGSKEEILSKVNKDEEYLIELNEDITNQNGEILDYINYSRVEGCYVARGGEKFIVIGNFRHDSISTLVPLSNKSLPNYSKAYFLVDDVSVEEFSEIPDYDNSKICINDFLLLNISELSNQENFLNGNRLDTNSIIKIDKAGNYQIESMLGTCYDSDEFNVESSECDNCKIYIPNAISPNNDGINDQIDVKSNCDIEVLSKTLYNRWGNVVWKDILGNYSSNYNMDFSKISTGVYIAEIKVYLKYKKTVQSITKDITIIH